MTSLRKVGDLCSVVTKGTTPTTNGLSYSESGVPFLRAENIKDGHVDLTSCNPLFIDESTHGLLGRSWIQPGDVLLTIAGTIGRVAVVQPGLGVLNCNQAIAILRPSAQLVPSYLAHWLQSDSAQHQIMAARVTATISNLSLGQIKELALPVPPIEKQKCIAEMLDKTNNVRRKRDRLNSLAEDLLRSVFVDVFGDPVSNPKGWPIRPLRELFAKERSGTRCGPFGSSLKKEDYQRSGVPVWGIENVLPDEFNPTPGLFIAETKFDQLRAFGVVPGDVLISRAGTVGRMCVVNQAPVRSIIGTNLIRLSLDEEAIHPSYFTAMFTLFADRFLRMRANAKTDAYSFMNTGVLASLELPVPDLETQHFFMSVQARVRGCLCRINALQAQNTLLAGSLTRRVFDLRA